MKVQRADIGSFGEPEFTPNGFLKVPLFATRAGVFTYKMRDGSVIKELRPPEEVFNRNSMHSLAGIPITDEHPVEMLDSKNTKFFQIGFTGDHVEKAGNFVRTNSTITDSKAIDEKIGKEGIREVSCGYSCQIEDTPGEFEGEYYDVIQRDIVYNHIALVEKGRAGPQARLQMDRYDGVMIKDEDKIDLTSQQKSHLEKEDKDDNINDGGDSMAKIKIDNVEYEVNEAIASLIVQKLNELKMLQESEATLKGKVDALEGELKKKEEEIEKVKTDSPDAKQLLKIAKERAELESFASSLIQDKKFDEMTDLEIKKEIVSKVYPNINLAEKEDSYVEGSFGVIFESRKSEKQDKNLDLKKDIGKALTTPSEQKNAEYYRKKQTSDTADLWQKKETDN